MLWIFIGITLGSIALIVQTVMKHLNDARGIEAQLRELEMEKYSLIQDFESQRAGTQEANAHVEEVKSAITILKATAGDLQTQISQKTATKERRGKFRVGPML